MKLNPHPRREEPDPSDPIGAFLGFLLLLAIIFSVYFVIRFAGRPERLSGSPTAQTTGDPQRLSGSSVPSTKERPEEAYLSWYRNVLSQSANDEKEFRQIFGCLLTIGHAPNGGYFAHFERIDQPVYNGQVIHGFKVRVLSNRVTFTKDGVSGGSLGLPQ